MVIRVLLSTTLLLLMLGASRTQEIQSDLLEKVRAITVLIKAQKADATKTGSGFLVLKQGAVGYVITHSLIASETTHCTVVFFSGTSREKAIKARVVFKDIGRPFTCLELTESADLPEPLALGVNPDLKEMEAAYIAGFSASDEPNPTNSIPEISFLKSHISSIRKDKSGSISGFVIDEKVNSGFSGGPMLTRDGRLIGMTVGIRMQSESAYAIPPEVIKRLLQGSVQGVTFRKLDGDATSAKYEVAVEVFDPLGNLTEVGLAYASEKAVTHPLKPELDGSWNQAVGSMKTVTVKVVGRKAVATLEFAPDGPTASMVFQAYAAQDAGRTQWTVPVALEVIFGAGSQTDPVKGRVWSHPHRSKETLEDPDSPSTYPPATTVDLPDEVTIVSELKILSVFSKLILSPDGRWLYALDLSEGRIYRLDPETLRILDQVEVAFGSVTMALTPDGKMLYVGGYRPAKPNVEGGGLIQAFTAADFKSAFTWEIKTQVLGLAATDYGVLAATPRAEDNGLSVLDVNERTEIVLPESRGYIVRLTPGHRRAYVSNFTPNASNLGCVELKKQLGTYQAYPFPFRGSPGSSFEITPDGKFLIGASGSVLPFRAASVGTASRSLEIEENQSIVMDPKCSDLLITTADGFLKAYSLGGFTLRKSVRLGFMCGQAVLDMPRRRLHAVIIPLNRDRDIRRNLPVSRVASFSLGGK